MCDFEKYEVECEKIRKENGYPGYFFIRRCMCSTPSTVKGTAASIKKFYKCMLDHGSTDTAIC